MANNQYAREMRKVVIPIGPSIAYVPLTMGQVALIDSEDAERVGRHNWYACWDQTTKHFYARTGVTVGYRKRVVIGLHGFILKCEQGVTADHKVAGNGLDCRRSNLRVATQSNQNHNQRIRVNNTSGYKGVSWHAVRRKWWARICCNIKERSLGLHATPELAHAAYVAAAKELHGEFANSGVPA